MKGPLFYSKILLFGEYGIIRDSKGLSIPYNFYNGAHQLIEGDWMLQFMNERTIALYNIVEDRMMRNNLIDKHPQVQQTMEQRIKALIQQYNNRLIDNELVPK